MDTTPKVVEDVPGHRVVERSPELEALIAEVELAAEAEAVSDNAEPIVITDDAGKEVRNLNVRLSPLETVRVMSLPPVERAQMATNILQERRLAAAVRKAKVKEEQAYTRQRKAKRKRLKKNTRRSK